MGSRKRVVSGLAKLSLAVLGSVFASVGYATVVEYRSFDGSGNNMANPDWGSTGSQLLRLGSATYSDGTSTPRLSVGGGDLPSTRAVSNAVVAQSQPVPNAKGVSDMLMQWGQFIDHDIDLSVVDHHDSMPIAVETADSTFGTVHADDGMPFSRSVYTDGVGTPRQQVNAITAYIDASQIYGSSEAKADSLRVMNSDGSRSWKLEMTYTVNGGMLDVDSAGMFISGDVRANEQVGLTSMHTLFNREHNRLGAEIAAAHPEYDDETVYQETRKLVGAMMQAITFNEFLPALLGGGAPGSYTGYKTTVNAGIANEFSTAAYRFGHSTLSPTLLRLDENGQMIGAGHLALEQAFFNPYLLMNPVNGGIEPILRGLISQPGQEVDPFLVDAVRNMLFPPPVDVGFDLAALNMQRGRDHGLPSYNQMRAAMGLMPYSSWADAVFMDGVKDLLMSIYTDINDIDLWIGGLAENHVNGGMLGELFSAIVGDQFSRLRDGDRFWYQNGMFETEWMEFIEGSTLSAIIMRNTGITGLQANVFFVPEPGVLLLLSIGIAGMGIRRRSSWRCAA